MKTKRRGFVIVLPKICRERINNNKCPICDLSKDQWKRRTDWNCCSTKCTKEFERKKTTYSWVDIRLKAIQRDNYKCVSCLKENYMNEGIPDIGIKEELSAKGLEVDHIIPIALGGKEFDLDNLQTLCKPCHKLKTKTDVKKIRRVE